MGTVAEAALAPADCERLLGDRRFRRRFDAAYRGSADPSDALWWLAHPDEPGPSGAQPPRPRPELRRQVYRPDAPPSAVAELRTTLDRIDLERDAALAALQAAVAEPEAQRPTGMADAVRATLQLFHPVSRRLLVAAVAALAIGTAAGAALALAALAARPPSAPPAPAFPVEVGSRAGLGVLDRPQRSGDAPFALVGSDLPRSTFRRLADYSSARTVLYAARDRLGQVCLVAADVYFHASCVDPAVWARDGVVLLWSSGPVWPENSALARVAVWRPDGRITAGAVLP